MPEERKLVTVLFADTTGSTAIGETFDPEDARALMGRYYDHARRVIAEHGGTLEKFIGDAVMAVFGLPSAHGDDPARALAAALALRAAVADDLVLGAAGVTLHLGVNTGEVVATSNPASGDFLVTGDCVNVAARLYDAAEPGEILAGERTHAAAGAVFRFGEVRTLTLKNKRLPVLAYALLAAAPAGATGGASHPPLVGRGRELAQLALLGAAALEERRPQLVSLVAPAGTGKTRLLEEYLARIDPAQGWQVATARCSPYGQTLTYWPLRGLLEQLLGDGFAHERVAAAFAADAAYAADDADRLAEHVLALLGVERENGNGTGGQVRDQAPPERESSYHAWRLLIETLAAQAPRIIVFEDLHWASESLLDLVEHLMLPRTQASLLIVATSRPELLDRRRAWGGGRRNFTALALEPLNEAQTRQLIAALAARLSVDALERVVERAGGNPFFAIELTRSLGSSGAHNGTAAAHLALPDTVHEAVLARLDLLAPDERAVLQTAAVAGRTFRLPTLAAALPTHQVSTIQQTLDDLLARDLIVPADAGTYTFRHILFRDVAYGTLSRTERIRLHTVVAEWLEQFAAGREDEFVELIAYHYREAALLARHSAVPLDMPVDTARAVRYLERAGEVAARAGASAEARGHLERAIELAAERDHLRLYESLGDCELSARATLTAYRQALACWRAEPAPVPLAGARLLRKLLARILRWGALSPRDSRAEVAALRAEAWHLVETADDEYERWRLRAVDLFWPEWSGEPTPEAELRRQSALGLAAAAYFEARGDGVAFSEALDGAGTCAKIVGDLATDFAALRRRLAAPSLPAWERGDALASLMVGQWNAADYAGALETAHAALARRRPGDPAILLAPAANIACGVAYNCGRWSEMAPFAAVIKEAWEEWGHDAGLARHLAVGFNMLLLLALAQEDQAAIRRAATARLRLMGPSPLPEFRAWFQACLRDDPTPLQTPQLSVAPLVRDVGLCSLILLFLNEHGLAAPHAVLALPAQHPWMRSIASLHRWFQIAEALAADDNIRLAGAIDKAETLGLIPHAARMRVVLAQRTGDLAPLERARPVLERLGDRQFLRRLAEVAATLAGQPATSAPARSRKRAPSSVRRSKPHTT